MKPKDFSLKKALGLLTLLVMFLLLYFFLIYPVFKIMSAAFWDGSDWTLRYFFLLFENQLQMEAIYQSLGIGLLVTLFCIGLSLPLAVFQTNYDFWGKRLLAGLLLVPMIMPPFVGAIGFQRFFARMGTINLWLLDWGIVDSPVDWLADENKFWAVVILEVLHLYPIMYLNLAAALANVDPSLGEAAKLYGLRDGESICKSYGHWPCQGFFLGPLSFLFGRLRIWAHRFLLVCIIPYL